MSDGSRQGTSRAVALRYTEELPAPMVVASGRGRAADTIARVAREHGVTIVRDTELSEALITIDVGSIIPEELYEGVAAVLAFVRSLDRRA